MPEELATVRCVNANCGATRTIDVPEAIKLTKEKATPTCRECNSAMVRFRGGEATWPEMKEPDEA